jgi:sirohydrochlorin cobaltochelatase
VPETASSPGDGAAIVLVVDAAVSPAVRDACLEVAADLADRAGVPVTLASIPACCLEDLRPALTDAEESRTWQFTPAPAAAPMSAAPFLFREDGRPDWGAMWQSFCELALYGGPPHRGLDSALRAPVATGATATDTEMIAEMQRGIWETTGLYSEPAEPGWLAITCDSPRMAAWLCAAIILENVDARMDDDRLLVPAGPGYRLKDEVKSIVTVVAKTHHYWDAHAGGAAAPDARARR